MLDLRSLSVITDFFVICTAGSARQVNALKDHIEGALHQRGSSVWHVEGMAGSQPSGPGQDCCWLLLDCGDVVVHVMDRRGRVFYDLERLWADAPRVAVTETGAEPVEAGAPAAGQIRLAGRRTTPARGRPPAKRR